MGPTISAGSPSGSDSVMSVGLDFKVKVIEVTAAV